MLEAAIITVGIVVMILCLTCAVFLQRFCGIEKKLEGLEKERLKR